MKALEVGVRVRINCPISISHGKCGVIWTIERGTLFYRVSGTPIEIEKQTLIYGVDIDGLGTTFDGVHRIGFERNHLVPIYDGDEPSTRSFDDIIKRPLLHDVEVEV